MTEGKQTSRLFVALPVSSEMREGVGKLSRKGLDGRFTAIDDLHITIRFLGDVIENKIPEIERALIRVRRQPFFVEADGMDAFYNKKQAILYSDIVSTKKLTALCTDITDVLMPLGFDFGMRPYVPHVTLARLKGAHRKSIEDYIEKNKNHLKYSWQAQSFTLMRSAAPDEKGRHYRPLSTFPLIY